MPFSRSVYAFIRCVAIRIVNMFEDSISVLVWRGGGGGEEAVCWSGSLYNSLGYLPHLKFRRGTPLPTAVMFSTVDVMCSRRHDNDGGKGGDSGTDENNGRGSAHQGNFVSCCRVNWRAACHQCNAL